MYIADILVEPYAMTLALLAEDQNGTAFPDTVCSTPRHRMLVGRDRGFHIARDRHAEPMLVRTEEAKLGSEVEIASAVRRIAESEDRPSGAIETDEVDLTEEREFLCVIRLIRGYGYAESNHLRPRSTARGEYAAGKVEGYTESSGRRENPAHAGASAWEECGRPAMPANRRTQNIEGSSKDLYRVILITAEQTRTFRPSQPTIPSGSSTRS